MPAWRRGWPHLVLVPLSLHAFPEAGLHLLDLVLQLVHLAQAGVQEGVVLVQQVQVAAQPGPPVLLHGGAPLLPGPQGALPAHPLQQTHPSLYLCQFVATTQLQPSHRATSQQGVEEVQGL